MNARVWLVVLVLGVALGATACGTDDDLVALGDTCVNFCELKAECDPGLDADYEANCLTACDQADYDNVDLDMSQALIGCAKYETCSNFNQCLSGGGSLTDDEYGQGSYR